MMTTDARLLLDQTRRELARLPAVLDAMLEGLDEAGARVRPAPEEWSPVEIVCHLRDEETEDFGARVRLIVEGGGQFVPIDPERWAVERRYRDEEMAVALAELEARRRASLDFLASVRPEALTGARPLRILGQLSGLDLLAAWVTHDGLHLRQLAGTLTQLWAMRWTPLHSEYAGPLPYADGPGAGS
jgi:hypothetical protein